MDSQNTKAILDASIAGDSQIRSDINALGKDVYSLNIQQLINAQNSDRNIDNKFCGISKQILSDGMLTRNALDDFKQLYQTDRYNDLARQNAQLKNSLNIAPLYANINAINSKFDSILGCTGVRTCNSGCGCVNSQNPYTIPPLVGTATTTRVYNPSVPSSAV